ncbi:MAG: rRNA maturation RNase YbeY [Paludibacter sp.]|nr:rRNA maturation RNase YbeY [Paludibacter sp.]
MIQFINENTEIPVLHKRRLTQWIKSTAEEYGRKTGDITYIFCSEEKILEINLQYLNHDYFTDIITFDYSEKNVISGDIFISPETLKTNAIQFNVTYEEELLRIIIHGILHLCGQDDKTPESKLQMTAKEDKALNVYKNMMF